MPSGSEEGGGGGGIEYCEMDRDQDNSSRAYVNHDTYYTHIYYNHTAQQFGGLELA